MRITKIETFKVGVPFIPAIRKYRPTEHVDGPILIIKIHTDEGIVGLGDAGRAGNIDTLIPRLIGQDPMAMNLAEADWSIQAALYDVVGKALNVPAYRLMGSKCRDRVPVGYWSCPMEPEEFAAEAEVAAKKGFTSHKLKARPWNVVKTVELITKAAGPGLSITLDPNFTFQTLPETVKIARQLEGHNVLCFEDPIERRWDQYHLLRQRIDIPIAPHLSNPSDVLAALQGGAADMFNLGGNLANATRSAAVAQAAGLPVWLQVAGLSLGISGAFATHVAAVVPNATIPSDSLHFMREHTLLVDNALYPLEGHVAVPEGPGLGVEMDEKALEKYRVG